MVYSHFDISHFAIHFPISLYIILFCFKPHLSINRIPPSITSTNDRELWRNGNTPDNILHVCIFKVSVHREIRIRKYWQNLISHLSQSPPFHVLFWGLMEYRGFMNHFLGHDDMDGFICQFLNFECQFLDRFFPISSCLRHLALGRLAWVIDVPTYQIYWHLKCNSCDNIRTSRSL
jgi:hypothetical protein